MSEQITGAQSLIRAMERAGVTDVFGIPGGAILPAYDPLMDSKQIRHILVRHEQAGGHAAEGYAAATGRVGVCMATSGPGATNLVTPIADAHMDSVPMVAITGQVPKAAIGTEDEILAALNTRTLTDRRNLLDAVPQRFARALEEAAKLATPEAVRVTLPGAIIKNGAELDQWLAGVRQQVEDKLKDGPVIL